MRTRRIALCATIVMLALAGAARADWDPRDGHKMHWPQMPNPNGWDICLNHGMIADDFQCGQTGPITDVHFWVSWQRDKARWDLIQSIDVSLFADGGNKPGTRMWGENILPIAPGYSYRLAGSGDQGWHCPSTPFTQQGDHRNYYQINLKPLPEPWFVQTQGQHYWLGLSVHMLPDETPAITADDPQIGWKTALPSDHWGEFSQFKNGAAPWLAVMPNGQSGDQAFVITPEPGTFVLLGMGGLGLAAFAWRRRRSG